MYVRLPSLSAQTSMSLTQHHSYSEPRTLSFSSSCYPPMSDDESQAPEEYEVSECDFDDPGGLSGGEDEEDSEQGRLRS